MRSTLGFSATTLELMRVRLISVCVSYYCSFPYSTVRVLLSYISARIEGSVPTDSERRRCSLRKAVGDNRESNKRAQDSASVFCQQMYHSGRLVRNGRNALVLMFRPNGP